MPSAEQAAEEELRLAVRGGEVFAAHCAACHPNGRRGVGPALDRTLHRGAMVRQIRDGARVMPGFDEHRLRERDLQAVLVYVAGLQRRGERERADAVLAVDVVDSLQILDLIADSQPAATHPSLVSEPMSP